MQTTFRNLLVGAILALGASVALAAAPAADPVIGSWTLNLAKSKFSADHAPKSQTRTYTNSAKGIVLTVKTIAADGKEHTSTMTFEADGKPYAMTGNPAIDTVAVTRVNSHTVTSVQTKGGAPAGTSVRHVSKDGKTLTLTQKGTLAAGGNYEDVSVYDRQ